MIKPLVDRVLIKIVKQEETTESGIILTSNINEKSQIANVIEVGLVKENEKSYVKKGDKIIVNKYNGIETEYKGEEYLIVKQEDILAIIE